MNLLSPQPPLDSRNNSRPFSISLSPPLPPLFQFRPRTISEYASLISSDPLVLLRSDASGCSLLDRARLHDEEPAVVAFLEEKIGQALECRDAFPGVDDETFKRNFQVWLDV